MALQAQIYLINYQYLGFRAWGRQAEATLDPDPDPSISKQKYSSKKNLDSYCFLTLLDLISTKNYVNVPSKSNKQKNFLQIISFYWRLEGQWQ